MPTFQRNLHNVSDSIEPHKDCTRSQS